MAFNHCYQRYCKLNDLYQYIQSKFVKLEIVVFGKCLNDKPVTEYSLQK